MSKGKKQKVTKKKTPRKKTTHHKPKPKIDNPDYVIQINEPKIVRKDILESLREVIIFMQGYEKFKKIQEEKVATFALLKSQVKELDNLIHHKLKKYFPQGKLKPTTKKKQVVYRAEPEPHEEKEVPPVQTYHTEMPKMVEKAPNELEELELQLKDIENQLQSIH